MVEIVAAGDGTWEKRRFYVAHNVNELLVIDPLKREIHWLALGSVGQYEPVEQSALMALGLAELTERIDWPQ